MGSLAAAASGLKTVPNLIEKLLRRKLIGAIYPESDEYRNKLQKILKKPATIYAGFDATSNSLHVGNLATIMNLIHFQRHGHRVICVIGDATAQIGDPSGHIDDRAKLDRSLIDSNATAIEKSLRNVFTNHELYFKEGASSIMQDLIVIRNSSWYQDKNVIEFISDIFREVRVGSLLHKKSISERLKSSAGLNMSEFSYQVFQAYDWLQLRKMYNCSLQLGGSDQAGNIYTGHDMIKKISSAKDSIGLLTPLITNEKTGKKLGKSADNDSQSNIWLNPKVTSPYNLYQFFHRTPDHDVEKFLKVFSLYEDNEIESMIQTNLKKSEDTWFCQRKLAGHVTKLVHGEDGLKSAKRISHAFFNGNPLDIAMLSDEELQDIFEGDSMFEMFYRDNLTVLDLIRRANCFRNDLDAERLIRGGGLRINGIRVTSFNVTITPDLIIGNDMTIMRIGKKNYYLFKWGRQPDGAKFH